MDAIHEYKFIEREGRRRAWHGLGTVFPADSTLSALQGCREIKADYETIAVPHVARLTAPDGSVIEYDTDQVDLWRTGGGETPSWIGTSSKKFYVMDNVKLCRAFDGVERWFPLETMGVLEGGSRFFFTFKAADMAVKVNGKDDPTESYIFVTDSKKPGESLVIGEGETRVVCLNTLQLAISTARLNLPIEHDAAAEGLVNHIGDMVNRIGAGRDAHHNTLQAMADRAMTLPDAIKAFNTAFPVPKESRFVSGIAGFASGKIGAELVAASEIIRERVEAANRTNDYNAARAMTFQHLAVESLMHMAEDQEMGINAYTVYNAAVEVHQHRTNTRGNVERDLMFGGRGYDLLRLQRELLQPELFSVE